MGGDGWEWVWEWREKGRGRGRGVESHLHATLAMQRAVKRAIDNTPDACVFAFDFTITFGTMRRDYITDALHESGRGCGVVWFVCVECVVHFRRFDPRARQHIYLLWSSGFVFFLVFSF